MRTGTRLPSFLKNSFSRACIVPVVSSSSSSTCGMHFLPFRRCHVDPSKPGIQILALILQHTEKRIVGVEKVPVQVPNGNTYDIGVNETPDPRFSFRQLLV